MAQLLLDTHVLIWFVTADSRLHARARNAILNPDNELFVSAVTAFELTDLQKRGRVTMVEDTGYIVRKLGCKIVDFPAEAWKILPTISQIHGDPVDRMLIAHALISEMTIVTADNTIPLYPVKTLR